MTDLRSALHDYLRVRRQLGFELKEPGRRLEDYVSFMERAGAKHVTSELALMWATSVSAHPHRWRRRLGVVRGFARYLSTIDPQTEVPSEDLLPAQLPRVAPYLYSQAEIDALMAAARELTPRLRAATFETLIGLLAVSGLRAGTWANVTDSWPQGHTVDTPIFTGTRILVAPGQIWCGACSHPPPFNEHGYLVDPKTLRRTPIPHGPLDDLGPQIIWTGTAEISLNLGGEISGPRVKVLPGDIAIWNPNTSRWARGRRAPKQLGDAPAVWSGQQLFALAQDGRLLANGR
jgi:hypothetical protein